MWTIGFFDVSDALSIPNSRPAPLLRPGTVLSSSRALGFGLAPALVSTNLSPVNLSLLANSVTGTEEISETPRR